MKKLLGFLGFWLVALIQFYALHLISLITVRVIFDGGWFTAVMASLFLLVFAFIGFFKGHELLSWWFEDLRPKHLFIVSLGSLVGFLAAVGWLGNYTNFFSWDDKVFFPFALLKAQPVRAVFSCIPFTLGVGAAIYLGIPAPWLGWRIQRSEKERTNG